MEGKSKKPLIKLIIGLILFAVIMVGSYYLYQYASGKTSAQQNLKKVAETEEPTEEPMREPTEEPTEEPAQEPTEEATQEEAEATNDEADYIDFKVENAQGEEVALSSLIGKPIILNFWASWCGRCQSEMPDFQAAYEEYGDEIEFVMINLTDGGRETKEVAQDFITENGYSFPVYYDISGEAGYAYQIASIPTTYFISKEGEIVASGQGALERKQIDEGIALLIPQNGEE